MNTKKKPEHYVNNKEFLQAMILYKRSVNKAKRTKIIKPSVPDYIGECFLKIANPLSYRPNFINYNNSWWGYIKKLFKSCKRV